MNIHSTSLKPASAGQSSFTAHGSTDTPKFIRPVKDRAPALAMPAMPDIDPTAPVTEKRFFQSAGDMITGAWSGIVCRLSLAMQREDNGVPTREQFMYRGKPATIEMQGQQLVMNVGSEQDGSAGHLTSINARVVKATGTLQDPAEQLGAIRYASLTCNIGRAQRSNMPHAMAALQALQQWKTLADESTGYQYVGS